MRQVCLCDQDAYCDVCWARMQARAERERLEKALVNFREKREKFRQALEELDRLAENLAKESPGVAASRPGVGSAD